jgi:hypothetical protein
MCTKLVELFANQVVKRSNMINSTYGEELALRLLGGDCFRGVLSLSFSLPFLWFTSFRVICWFCGFSFF